MRLRPPVTNRDRDGLSEIRARVEERHSENLRRFDTLDENDRVMNVKLDSLLATRSFYKGVLKTAGIVAGVVATFFSLAIAYLRGH